MTIGRPIHRDTQILVADFGVGVAHKSYPPQAGVGSHG